MSNEIGLYPSAYDKKIQEQLSFSDMMIRQKSGDYFGIVDRMRRMKKINPSDYKKNKTSVICFTGSGIFDKSRTDSGILQHNGRLIMDFDNIPVSDLRHVKEKIKEDPFSEYVFETLSGEGLAAVIKIDPTRHRDSFKWLENYYKAKYNLMCDPSCVNESRLRYVTYDPDLYHNPDSKTLSIPTVYIENNDEKFEICASSVLKKYAQGYTEGVRHKIILSTCMMCNNCGIPQIEALPLLKSKYEHEDKTASEIEGIAKWVYNKFSSGYGSIRLKRSLDVLPPEVSSDIMEVYKKAGEMNRDGIKWEKGVIVELAHQYLIDEKFIEDIFRYIYKECEAEFGINKKPIIAKVEVFIGKHYDVSKNIVLNKIEIKEKGEVDQDHPLSCDDIYRSLQHVGLKYSLDNINSLLRSSFVRKYDPFLEYFKSLPAISGTENIQKMASAINVSIGVREFYEIQYKKFLVRSIGCALGKRVNRFVFTLVGEKQNTGKSTWIQYHNPFKNGMYLCETPLRDDKDTEVRFAENFIYNLEELASIKNKDVDKLKAIISKTFIKERKAFRPDDEMTIRRCNFWGSTNKAEFLTDSENTRWLCFPMTTVDFSYSQNVDINLVWAEAWNLYQNHRFEEFNLTLEESKFSENLNENFQVSTNEINTVKKYYAVAEKDEPGAQFMTATDFCVDIRRISLDIPLMNNIMIGKALTFHKFQKDKVKGVSGFWARPIIRGEIEVPRISEPKKDDKEPEHTQGQIPF